MFGKSPAQYLSFQKYPLLLTALVGLLRLAVSLAGAPNDAAAWLSMNVVLWASAVYYGIAVHTRGFGGYRQILPLLVVQVAIYHLIAVTGIVLAIAGVPNVFAAPEYSGPADAGSQWLHALSHLTVGMVAAPLVLWAVASLALWTTRRLSGGAARPRRREAAR
jgi:hypothetical protein